MARPRHDMFQKRKVFQKRKKRFKKEKVRNFLKIGKSSKKKKENWKILKKEKNQEH